MERSTPNSGKEDPGPQTPLRGPPPLSALHAALQGWLPPLPGFRAFGRRRSGTGQQVRVNTPPRTRSEQALPLRLGKLNLTEQGGLDREPWVGLISIATRNSSSHALALPPDGEAGTCVTEHDPPEIAPLHLTRALLAAATLPTAQPASSRMAGLGGCPSFSLSLAA